MTASALNTFAPSTKITNASGTSAAPSYTFDGDEDTGIYRSAANRIAFAVGGTLAAYFDVVTDGPRFLGPGLATGTSIIRPNAGSAAAPTYTFYGDEDTGMLRSAANEIAFATGGTQRLTIKSDGDVGIGTGNPSVPLHVATGGGDHGILVQSTDSVARINMQDDSSTDAFAVGVGATGNALSLFAGSAEKVRVADDGDVGIGTTSPGARLHINSGDTNNGLIVESTDAGAIISLKDNSTTGNQYVGIRATGDKLVLRAGNNNHVDVESAGTVKLNTEHIYTAASDKTLIAAGPPTGTGNDAEWAAPFGIYVLYRNSSLAAEKENVTADLGEHLTADMIDSVVPKMWNRIHAPGYPEIGPIAEEMDAISPFLAARGTTAENVPFLTGINKTAYLSLLVLAVKDLRARVATLEA